MTDFDLDLARLLPAAPTLDADTLPLIRPYAATPIKPRPESRQDLTVDGIPLSVFRPGKATTDAPCIYWIHGGGMVMGDRFAQIDIPLEWLDLFGAVVVTVDYRLAPEATGTAPVDDCYRGLTWIADHAADLGIDPARVIVASASAGGGLAAGVTLMARDRGGPPIAGQILIGPMLDHRNDTTSSHQFAGGPGTWTRESNEFAWRCLLGDRTDVPDQVSPALAGDLSGLPTAYIDAGSAEVFRDEDVAYATRIWAAGGQAELHIWAGGFHGFDALHPDVPISRSARRTRTDWLDRLLRKDPTT